MHKCGLCRHAVSVRMSIRPSRSWILSKRVNISSKFFHHQVAKHSSFYIPNSWQYSDRNPLTWASNAGGVGTNRRYNWLSIDRWMTCWTCEQQVQQSTVQFTTQTATHQWCYIYHSLQHARPRRREEKRREENLFVCSGKSEAELGLDVLYYWSYWQTRNITRPLCDSRATCFYCHNSTGKWLHPSL